MFQGLRTVVYGVDDLEKAKTWYSEVLGIQPYFDQPVYVGFNVGGFELGLDPHAPTGSNGPATYWGVADAHEAYRQLIATGAHEKDPIHDVGDDILLGSVIDPFGNELGIIQNPHFSLQ
ncbi:MAG TPA: VOC family protein [Ktedonobacteraceae bacterium]|nr:VOC family protein [Ktedonobacteraceae bacterium]